MGQMRFLAPSPERLAPHSVERAYLAGMDVVPWCCDTTVEDDEIIIRRDVSESGLLYIPWKVEGRGEITLSTTSLMERQAPYHLAVELARGTVNRLRNQMFRWEAAGMVIADELKDAARQATRRFTQSATNQADRQESEKQAQACLVQALDCIDRLSITYAGQVFKLRHEQTPKLATLLGAALPPEGVLPEMATVFRAAFNAAVPALMWRDIEPSDGEFDWEAADRLVDWCQQMGLRTCSGPLLRLSRQALPDWIYLWEDDFDHLLQYVQNFVTKVVSRYRGRIHVWQCAAGLNVPGALALSEERSLRLAVATIDAVRRADPRAPVIVTFDSPWAEFFADDGLDLAPLNFADLLVRADLGMAGVALEINYGYWPGGTLPRDLMEINRQIDEWTSRLGLPLLVMLTAPGGKGEDAQARGPARPLPGPGDSHDAASQQRIVEQLVPLLLSKSSVHGVIWNQLLDAAPHTFPHGGLFTAEGAAKPALASLQKIREEHLS